MSDRTILADRTLFSVDRTASVEVSCLQPRFRASPGSPAVRVGSAVVSHVRSPSAAPVRVHWGIFSTCRRAENAGTGRQDKSSKNSLFFYRVLPDQEYDFSCEIHFVRIVRYDARLDFITFRNKSIEPVSRKKYGFGHSKHFGLGSCPAASSTCPVDTTIQTRSDEVGNATNVISWTSR